MPRKRGRKKAQKTDILQVDLLEDQAPPEQELEVPDAPTDGASGNGPATDSHLPDKGGERWAKAAGQLRPARSGARGAEPPARDRSAAHDHASVRAPAGQPLARARDLVRGGRVQEAIELYLGILTVNPDNLKAHNNLGVLLDELKQFDAALGHFEAAEKLAPENVEVLVNYASTLTSLARYDRAEDVLRRAQRQAPEDTKVRLGVGILFFRRGLYGQAEAELRWVLTKDPADGNARYYRGEALKPLGPLRRGRRRIAGARSS